MFSPDAAMLRQAMQAGFDAPTLSRGEAYHREQRVLNCTSSADSRGWLLRADVRGTAPDPYAVQIQLAMANSGLLIENTCSCPMERGCKHVAAALFVVADAPQRFFTAPNRAEEKPAANSAPESDRLMRLTHRGIRDWLTGLEQAAGSKTENKDVASQIEETPQILYIVRLDRGRLRVEVAQIWRVAGGRFCQPHVLYAKSLLDQPKIAPYSTATDRRVIRHLLLLQPSLHAFELYVEGAGGAEVLKEMLATGRCHWRSHRDDHHPLTLGDPRPAKPVWQVNAEGEQRPALDIVPPASEAITSLAPPWYVDHGTGLCGPLEMDLTPELATAWLRAPAMAPADALVVAELFIERKVPLPLPPSVERVERKSVTPVPCLRLFAVKCHQRRYARQWVKSSYGEETVHFARLEFSYDGQRCYCEEPSLVVSWLAEGKLNQVHRATDAERAFVQRLRSTQLRRGYEMPLNLDLGKHSRDFTCANRDWLNFLHADVAELRAEGWQIDIDDSFTIRVATPEAWYTNATPESGSSDWFSVELGVLIDGEKVNLLPVLLNLLQSAPRLLESELASMSDEAVIPVPLPDGRKLLFPASRARQMLGALLELLNPGAISKVGTLRLTKLRAAELAAEPEWRWLGTSDLAELGTRLRNFEGIKAVDAPAALRAVLRRYQAEGLSWLQFLREYEIGGVLADDMGLGKTVQTLAHLLVEKHSGRMDRPSLIVAPTTLMTNWRQEAERFAPDLRLLVLHGQQRKRHFGRIADHDVVLTSYPLLARDLEVLREHHFHYLILDEAQFIKNPKTTYAKAVCSLKARHHLCLTGTPMENHLGELWSLFHFLLPGFLGDDVRFNTVFRRPIEKERNEDRRKLLARRIGPFILRRRKEEVATELPPKTVIVQNVELIGAQRDLYESVRLAVHTRVREEIDRKGISRAQIVILDALLKLRQICCHPQLLRMPSAESVTESAKLELLLDMLPAMIEEGRRVLLFSQFTSMLGIITTALAPLKIPHVLLTGDTRDRATPVHRFQSGEVPLFLISLKAGGTGLNLTAADTVIHYDPWWNPAVENQATDRAHRIGQEKNVFVYKLMTVGTVEEKILALQARKRELVEGLLNEERRDTLQITAADLEVLFAPMDDGTLS